MSPENVTNMRIYDLEERTFQFAKDVRIFIKKIQKTLINLEDCKQLLKSSGSVGANYIEANEALSRKDFLMRIRISRKEAKESTYWLRLINVMAEYDDNVQLKHLLQESIELKKIFSSIINKSK
jgi:four helix bundle protein